MCQRGASIGKSNRFFAAHYLFERWILACSLLNSPFPLLQNDHTPLQAFLRFLQVLLGRVNAICLCYLFAGRRKFNGLIIHLILRGKSLRVDLNRSLDVLGLVNERPGYLRQGPALLLG